MIKDDFKGARILIVDDNPANIGVLYKYLNKFEFTILAAQEGFKAISLIEREKPDLILLDIMMPDISGIEVCRRIKNNPALSDIPVIFLSALTHTQDKVEGFEAGGVDYITKPFQNEEVLARVQAHLTIIKQRNALQNEVQQRKKAEDEMHIAMDKAEKANKAKSDFLASMSHELRTPLNGILGYAQILRRDISLNENQREGVEIIFHSSEHLLNLINDILDLSKIEARKLELMPSDFLMKELVKNVIDVVSVKAKQKRLQFLYEESTTLPDLVRGDERKIKQILLNILGNAIKFTDEGNVTLKLAFDENKNMLMIRVSDTGIGIEEQKLHEIFEPFEQVSDNSKKVEGTGLGLAITKQLIELMDGFISVKSEYNKGTEFHIQIPLTIITEYEMDKTSSYEFITGYKGERKRILVVDDKEENIKMITQMLEAYGFIVFNCLNGKDAIYKADEIKPDLILIDLVMPGIDGFEATRRIRMNHSLKDVIIIAISASVFSLDEKQSRSVGCDDFIPKPIRLDLLLLKLKEYLKLEWTTRASSEDKIKIMDDITSPQLKPKAEYPLPDYAQLDLLIRKAEYGDLRGIFDIIDAIEKENDTFIRFCNELRIVAKDYHMEKIITFIKSQKG